MTATPSNIKHGASWKWGSSIEEVEQALQIHRRIYEDVQDAGLPKTGSLFAGPCNTEPMVIHKLAPQKRRTPLNKVAHNLSGA